MDTIIRINMSQLSTTVEPVPARWRGLGGRGLTSTIITAEVPPSCHPLGENNKLVFAPGVFTGTLAADDGGLSVGGKSVRTGGIQVDNSGGSAGRLLAQLGVKAVILEGLPRRDKWYNIRINKDGTAIEEETELIGKGNLEVIAAVQARSSETAGIVTLGPAGEMKMVLANISLSNSEGKIQGRVRGGLGAVLGSKKIKFISIESEGGPGVTVREPMKFRVAARTFAKAMLNHQTTHQGLPTCATAVLISILNKTGGIATRDLASDRKVPFIITRVFNPEQDGAHHRVNRCSIVCNGAGNEFSMVGGCDEKSGLSAECCINDPHDIAMAGSIMDDLGVDRLDTALMFGAAMEAGILPFGDGKGVCRILKDEIGKGSPLGRMLGAGDTAVGKAHGLIRGSGIVQRSTSGVCALKSRGIRQHEALDGLGNVQITTAAVESSGMHRSVAFLAMDCPGCLEAFINMLNARSGLMLTKSDIAEFCKHILRSEHNFNAAAESKQYDNCIPDAPKIETVEPNLGEWDFSQTKIDQLWNR